MNPIFILAAATVLQFAHENIERRIAGTDPAVSLSRFDDYPPSKGKLGFPRCLFENPFPANGKFWLKDVDFSCASPWNDSTGNLRAGTLISRRHIVFAKHFPLWKGVRILFAGADGGVCPCSVDAVREVPQTDIMIGLLNAEVTPNIRPAKILPPDFAKDIGDGKGLPIVTLTQHERAFLSECRGITTNSIANVASTSASWKALGGKIVVGDSGNPAFLLIGNEPILLYCLQSGGVGHGPALHRYRSEIQSAMDALCPGYKLESFDFSAVGATLVVHEKAPGFDGAMMKDPSGISIQVAYRGWVCRYETDGFIVDAGRTYGNRNGHYRLFEARGRDRLAAAAEAARKGGYRIALE